MSGKDERKLVDVPSCPICGRIPLYWTLDGADKSAPCVGWLLSDRYVEKNRNSASKHVLVSKYAKIRDFAHLLEKIFSVQCSNSSEHLFVRDTAMFRVVQSVVERYYAKEEYHQN